MLAPYARVREAGMWAAGLGHRGAAVSRADPVDRRPGPAARSQSARPLRGSRGLHHRAVPVAPTGRASNGSGPAAGRSLGLNEATLSCDDSQSRAAWGDPLPRRARSQATPHLRQGPAGLAARGRGAGPGPEGVGDVPARAGPMRTGGMHDLPPRALLVRLLAGGPPASVPFHRGGAPADQSLLTSPL